MFRLRLYIKQLERIKTYISKYLNIMQVFNLCSTIVVKKKNCIVSFVHLQNLLLYISYLQYTFYHRVYKTKFRGDLYFRRGFLTYFIFFYKTRDDTLRKIPMLRLFGVYNPIQATVFRRQGSVQNVTSETVRKNNFLYVSLLCIG